MTSFVSLLKVQLFGAFGIGRLLNERNSASRRRLALAAAGIVLLALLAAGYAGSIGAALAAVGAADALPALAVAASGVGCAVAAFVKANGLLFGFKDFDLVVTAPVPLWAVALSRVVPLYGMGLASSFLLGGPLLAIWTVATAAGAAGVAAAVCVLLFAPLVPIVVAVAVSFCIAWAVSRTPFGDRALGVVGLAATVIIVVGIMVVSTGVDASAADGLQALSQVGSYVEGAVTAFWPPAAWAAAALDGDAAAFACYVGISVAIGVAATVVLGRTMVPLNSLLAASGSHRASDARWCHVASAIDAHAFASGIRVRSPFSALVAKELKGWISTPIYLMNTAVGPALALVAAVAGAMAGPQVLASAVNVPGADHAALAALMASLFPWMLAFCMVMTPLSASSTSLEGNARWIAQTAPVLSSALVGSKIAANLIATVPVSALAGGIAAVSFASSPADAILCVAAPLSGGLLVSCLGALLDVRRPRFDWASAYEPVKRSANVGICIAVGVLSVLGGSAVTMFAGTAAGIVASVAIAVASIFAGRAAARIPLQDR